MKVWIIRTGFDAESYRYVEGRQHPIEMTNDIAKAHRYSQEWVAERVADLIRETGVIADVVEVEP